MKTYIFPQTLVVKVDVQSALLTLSQSDKEISEGNAGLVKGEKADWNDIWSE